MFALSLTPSFRPLGLPVVYGAYGTGGGYVEHGRVRLSWWVRGKWTDTCMEVSNVGRLGGSTQQRSS